MTAVNQGYELLYHINQFDWENELINIEAAARNCYQSKADGDEKRNKLIQKIVKNGHGAMLEFGEMIVRFKTDRAITHAIVRHRHFSYAQESTQYCKYKNNLTFIKPSTWDNWHIDAQKSWTHCMEYAELNYLNMLNLGLRPQQARSVLPNSIQSILIVKGNFREWLHFFKLRDSDKDTKDMQNLVKPLHDYVKQLCPVVFDAE